jgi:predicted Zn-dependent protease
MPVFGSNIIYYGSDRWTVGKYKSADDIIRSSPKNEKGQVDAIPVLEKLRDVNKSMLEPGAIVLITSKDLYARGYNWCFGMAMYNYRTTVQSLHRYQHLPDDVKSFCIRRTLRHELGHLFGCAANPSRSNTENKCGQHCTNPGCSMNQTMTVAELVQRMSYECDTDFLCPQCKQDLQRFLNDYENDQRRINALIKATREATRGRLDTRRV